MMGIGRPQEYDKNEIANKLINWSKKDDSINLNKFCALNSIPPSYLSVWAKESETFSQAYELAKSHLGYRREEMLTMETLHVKAYDLNAATYDYFLKEEKRKQAEFESSLRKDEGGTNEKTIHVKVSNGLGSGVNVSAEAVSA